MGPLLFGARRPDDRRRLAVLDQEGQLVPRQLLEKDGVRRLRRWELGGGRRGLHHEREAGDEQERWNGSVHVRTSRRTDQGTRVGLQKLTRWPGGRQSLARSAIRKNPPRMTRKLPRPRMDTDRTAAFD